MFRARDAVDQQIQLYTGDDAESVKRRQELEQERERGLKQALGSDRYQMYKLSQDPVFRQAQVSLEQIGAPVEAVLPIYQINRATEQERQRIRGDTNLTRQERAAAIETVVSQQEESLKKILGEDAFELYQQSREQ